MDDISQQQALGNIYMRQQRNVMTSMELDENLF